MSNTENGRDEEHSGVPKKIHHIWIGSLIKQKELDYAAVWEGTNDGTDMRPRPLPKYASKIWVDPNALMVGALKSEILRWAEWKALKENGITDVKTFDRKMIDFSFREVITKRIVFWATKQRFVMENRLRGMARKDEDGMRVRSIALMQAMRLGKNHAEVSQSLHTQLEQDRGVIEEKIKQGVYSNVASVLMKYDNRDFRDAYLQELNLRQNMAAAADILRVLVLKQEGGVYADLDLLPRFKSSAFIQIAQALEAQEYVMPEQYTMRGHSASIIDWSEVPDRLMAAVTDAVVLRLGLIDGYAATRSYEILSSELPPGTALTPELQKRQHDILTRVVNDIISAHYPGKFDCFHRLGELDPYLGFAFSFYKKGAGGKFLLRPNNQFIVSEDSRFIDGVYTQLERNYDFLRNPEVRQKLIGLAIRPNTQASVKTEFKVLWYNKYGKTLPDTLADAFTRYMADGIEPYAVSTVVISGPIVYEGVSKSIVAEWEEEGNNFSPRVRESQDYNANTSDGAESTWWVSTHGVAALRAKQFPDAPPRPTLSGDGDGTVAWRAPMLPTDKIAPDDRPGTRYKQQFIVQLDGDEVSLHAAQALFEKHPDQSTLIQVRPDGLHFFYSDANKQAAFRYFGPGQFFNVQGDTRISFVGHGKEAGGIVTLGGRTMTGFVSELERLLGQGAVSSDARLTINLVACGLDSIANAQDATFAGQLAQALPGLTGRLELEHAPELHARLGAVSVDDDGRKDGSRVVYYFEDNAYVRETTLDLAGVSPGRSQIELAAIGLSNMPPERADSQHDQADHHVVLTWDEEEDNIQAAVQAFNRDPAHSIYVDLMDGGRSVFFDERQGRLMVREGYSALSRNGGLRGHVNISLFGQRAGSIERPTFDGMRPQQLVDWLNPVLAKLFRHLDVSKAENRLTLTLEGIDHADPLLSDAHSFMGQLGQELKFWMSVQATDYPHDMLARLSLETRAGHLDEVAGEAVYVSATGEMVRGELAPLYDTLHRAHFFYNAKAGRFEREAMPSPQLREIGRQLNALRSHTAPTGAFKADLDRVTIEYLKVLRHAAGAPPMTPYHRSDRQKSLAELAEIQQLRRERIDALASIESPGAEYALVPERVETLAHGAGYRVGFARRNAAGQYLLDDAHITWVNTQNDVFARWLNKAHEFGAILKSDIVPVEGVSPLHPEYWFRKQGDADAAHTVSAAFLFQALIGPEHALIYGDDDQAVAALAGKPIGAVTASEKEKYKRKLPLIRAQLAVNYAQLTHGAFSDAVHLAHAVSALRKTSIDEAAGAAKSTLGQLGIAFDIAGVVLASIDLANAQDADERTRAGTRLSVALVNSGMSMGASMAAGVAHDVLGTDLAGLAVPLGITADMIGGLATPIAGVGMGVVAVVDAYQALAAAVDKTLHTLEHAAQGARGPTLTRKKGVITFTDGLVLESFDMSSGEAVYGSVQVRALKRFNRFVAPDASHQLLDLYRPFLSGDVGRTTALDRFNDARTVVLPSALARHYDYTLVASPGWRYSNAFPMLGELEKFYPDQFYWWTYREVAGIFGWDYSPSELKTTYHSTSFTLELDSANRGVVVPIMQEALERELVHYTLKGKGGRYSVGLALRPVDLKIHASGDSAEHWSFDITNAVYETDVTEQGVARGVARGVIRQQALHDVRLTETGLMIAGQAWAAFDQGKRVHANMFFTLESDRNATVVFINDGHLDLVGEDLLNENICLQYETAEKTDQMRFKAVTAELTQAGIEPSIVRIRNADQSYGVLDLINSRSAMTTRDNQADLARLWVDGKQVLAVQASGFFRVAAKTLLGATIFMASIHLEQNTSITLMYDADGLREAIEQRMGKPLFDALTGTPDPQLASHAWTKQLAVGTQIQIIEKGSRQTMTAVIEETPARMLRPVRLGKETEHFAMEVDLVKRRAIVKVGDVAHLAAQDLAPYKGLFKQADEIKFVFLHSESVRRTLEIDATQALFQNKAISVHSVDALDLTVDGNTVQWELDENDVILRLNGVLGVRWLGALGSSGLIDHTLARNGGPAVPLLDMLGTLQPLTEGRSAIRYQPSVQRMAQAMCAYPQVGANIEGQASKRPGHEPVSLTTVH